MNVFLIINKVITAVFTSWIFQVLFMLGIVIYSIYKYRPELFEKIMRKLKWDSKNV